MNMGKTLRHTQNLLKMGHIQYNTIYVNVKVPSNDAVSIIQRSMHYTKYPEY